MLMGLQFCVFSTKATNIKESVNLCFSAEVRNIEGSAILWFFPLKQ